MICAVSWDSKTDLFGSEEIMGDFKDKVISWHSENGKITGYAWLSDFVTELGFNPHGTKIYPTQQDCEADSRSDNQDGIVKIQISLTETVRAPQHLETLVSDLRQYRRSWTAIEIPDAPSEREDGGI